MNSKINSSINISRRNFVVTSGIGGTGLALGLTLPGLAKTATSEGSLDEINAWAVVNADDSVVIRVVRSEMGQGTLTGLAQLVAEELDCDWSKVTTEQPTPGESLARQRPWGAYATGGSRGIRQSHQYVSTCAKVAQPPNRCCSKPRPTSGKYQCQSALAKTALSTTNPLAGAPLTAK